MTAGYHLIWTAYGYWLPNDPRGSTSREIRNAEIAALGNLHYGRRRVQPAGQVLNAFRAAASSVLRFPLLLFTPTERAAIGAAFGETIRARQFTCYACAVMPDHVHLLIRKHRDPAETMIGGLQAASRAAVLANPQAERDRAHPVWGGPGWKVFLHTREDMQRTIRYVERNPGGAGETRQSWPFVSPYDGWLPGQVRMMKRPTAKPAGD
jgi:REP element-mobilizing transposase RayT